MDSTNIVGCHDLRVHIGIQLRNQVVLSQGIPRAQGYVI